MMLGRRGTYIGDFVYTAELDDTYSVCRLKQNRSDWTLDAFTWARDTLRQLAQERRWVELGIQASIPTSTGKGRDELAVHYVNPSKISVPGDFSMLRALQEFLEEWMFRLVGYPNGRFSLMLPKELRKHDASRVDHAKVMATLLERQQFLLNTLEIYKAERADMIRHLSAIPIRMLDGAHHRRFTSLSADDVKELRLDPEPPNKIDFGDQSEPTGDEKWGR